MSSDEREAGVAADEDALFAAAAGRLPRWWLLGLVVTIAFAAGYWLWHEAFDLSPGPLDRYIAARAEVLETGAPATEELLLDLASDELSVRAGARAFEHNCATCHGPGGEGKVGPNLTDPYWIAGGSAVAIYTTIVEGRSAQGMQPWGAQLGFGACKQLTAYLVTLRGRALPGKAPQGERWPPTSVAP